MKVIKRDGRIKDFDFTKIENAIKKVYSNKSVNEEVPDKLMGKIFENVVSFFEKCKKKDENYAIPIEQIQDIIRNELIKNNQKKAVECFILYRDKRNREREKNSWLTKEITKKIKGSDIQNQNANVDEESFGGKSGEITRTVMSDYAVKYLVSKTTRDNHNNNIVYVHDRDSYAVGMHNCLSQPFDKMLFNGVTTRQTDVRKANSIGTACQLVAVYFQLQSLNQFGGVSATHLDWTLVPFFRKSFEKNYIYEYIKTLDEFYDIDFETINDDDLNAWISNKIFEFFENTKLTSDSFYLDNKKSLNNKFYQCSLFETRKDLYQSIEGLYHNLNTLQSRSGNQLPFTSLNYGTCTLKEGRMITKALLETSIKGIGKNHETPIFPCGIFQIMKGVNDKKGTPNYDLKRLALYSTSKRLYPNYANCDWSNQTKWIKKDRTEKLNYLNSLSAEEHNILCENLKNNKKLCEKLDIILKDDDTFEMNYMQHPYEIFSTMGCHAKGTKIIMSDGTRKNVEDVVVGDKLMGVNNDVRTVEKLIRGNGKMYKVEQSRGETYIVNDGHILALEYSSNKQYKNFKKGEKVNMTINELLSIPESTRRFFKGYKSSYELSEKEYDIPPYILGLWLGDGNSHNTRFSVNIHETKIIDDLSKYAESIGKKLTIREEKDEECLIVDIADSNTRNEGNKFRQSLIKYNLIGNKHIPDCYFYGSKTQRSALLAGLINTDGWSRNGRGRQSVCFGNTNLNLIYGVKKLAESLGLTVSVIKARGESIGYGICEGSLLKPYYHVNIHRYDNELLMEHKRTNINFDSVRNFSTSTLKITELENDNFYGFELDGDRLYLLDDCTVTHNCRTANGYDINFMSCYEANIQAIINNKPLPFPTYLSGAQKDGRGNICPVTLILPTIAMMAKEGSDDVVENFFKILNKKIHEAKDSLIERFNWISSQSPKCAKFMYENGTMEGYVESEGIISALKHGTLAIGQLGLAETLHILIGKDHTTDEGMDLAIRIETLFEEKCEEFKKEYSLNFGVYYTPAENLCYTAFKKWKETYGDYRNVTYFVKQNEKGEEVYEDKMYFTNSMHVPVWYKMSAFEKIDIESKLTTKSSAGCITYVEMPNKISDNIDALETVVDYAMEHDIPYFAVNVVNNTCCSCGYQGDIKESCPKCGSDNIKRLGRVTGYLTGNYPDAFNKGKISEFEDREKHNKEIKF